jgi:hypothetical protein
MSGSAYPDQVRVGLSWIWRPYRAERDRELAVAIDSMLTKAFRDEGYSDRSRDDYFALVRSSYRFRPDMTQSFFGGSGIFATCYGCEQEPRGLHIHSLPSSKTEADGLLSRIERRIRTPALRVFLLRSRIPQLTLGHKFTVFTGMYAIIGTILGLTASFPLGSQLQQPVVFLFSLTVLLSFLYFFGIVLAMFVLYYYEMKLVWMT